MKTNRVRIATTVGSLLLLACAGGVRAGSAGPAPPQSSRPKATRAEYDAYQAAAAEKNPQQKIKLLDEFLAKYPNTEYLAFVYNEYVTVYYQLHLWSKDIDYLDKFLALSEINEGARLAAEYQRSAIFESAYNAKAPDAKEQATKARDAALAGLKVLEAFNKPEQMSDKDWEVKRSQYAVQFYNTAGVASLYMKDFKPAAVFFSKSLAENAEQPVIYYSLGKADLQEEPPQYMDGFWAVARALDLKLPDADKVKKFLRRQILDYEQPTCESSVDAQINELLALAHGTAVRPTSYSIPSAADLANVREKEVPGLLAELRAGGDKGKLTWLAVCNGEFPEAFLGKVYEISAAAPDAIVVKAAIGTKEEELNAGSALDGDLKISGQPNAARLGKDDIFRFAGKLTGYTPSPFNLSFANVKVNPEDIPEEKGKKSAKRPGKAKP